jgi:hypothetical protein
MTVRSLSPPSYSIVFLCHHKLTFLSKNRHKQLLTPAHKLTPTMSRSRAYVFTVNNYTEINEDALRYIVPDDASYIVFGREVGESGTPHLQGFVYFNNAKTLTAAKHVLNCGDQPHLERAITLQQAIDYCKKDGDYEEYGTPPKTQKEKGQMEKDRWDNILSNAKAGRFEEIDSKIQVLHCKNLEYLRNKALSERVPENTFMKHAWIHGPSRTGKTRMVREMFPFDMVYIKMNNKWWDGYRGEPVVLIEDIDPNDTWLGGHFKRWLDWCPFPVEVKGASLRQIRPKFFVITSNWSIDSIWSDQGIAEPLHKRVQEFNFEHLLDRQTCQSFLRQAKFQIDPEQPISPTIETEAAEILQHIQAANRLSTQEEEEEEEKHEQEPLYDTGLWGDEDIEELLDGDFIL